MSGKTHIAWTEATWNPTIGCTRVSSGCDKCYAFALHDQRYAAWKRGRFPKAPAQYHKPFSASYTPPGADRPQGVQLLYERLTDPLHWRAPRLVFVNSMSDLFHETVPDEFIAQVFAVMASTPQHTFQVLTKRPERMLSWMRRVAACAPAAVDAYLNSESMIQAREARREKGMHEPPPPTSELRFLFDSAMRTHDFGRDRAGWSKLAERHWSPWPLPNVWLGVSVENQRAADERIPLLLQTPAAVRFLSCEPLLAPVDISHWLVNSPEMAEWCLAHYGASQPLSWIIVGGESGPHYRPMNLDWARSLRDQCQAAGVPFFFKQGSGLRPGMNRELDGRLWEEMPTVAAARDREAVMA